MPLLHDEIATFFYYVQSDNYLPPEAHWDANNHILNSFLTNISYHLFGNAPIALRLPNVISYGFYLFAAYHLVKGLKSSPIRWATLLAFIMSHYLFEYFAESRGYGMSIAFLMMGFYFFQLIRNRNQIIDFIGLFFFVIAAAAANLTLVVPALLFFAMTGLHLLIARKEKNIFPRLGIVVLSTVPLLTLIKVSFAFKERGAFYYGSDKGFYEVTVKTLSEYILCTYNLGIAIVITLLTGIIISLFIFRFLKAKQASSWTYLLSPQGIFAFVFLMLLLGIFALYYVLGINFPEDRVAMHLYPLFVLALGYALEQISDFQKRTEWVGIILLIFPVLFLFHLHPKHSVFSTQERTSPAIFEYIRDTPNPHFFPLTVGGYKTQEFCWYYLNSRSGGGQGKIHTNYHVTLDADFQIIRNGKNEDSILFDYYQPVVSDPYADLTLFERKTPLSRQLVFDTLACPTSGVIKNEYHNILEMDISKYQDGTLYAGAEITLNAAPSPFIAWLAINVNDEVGKSLYSDYIPMDWIRKDWKGEKNNVKQGILIHHVPPQAKTLKFYLWNIEEADYSIPDGKCYLYELKRDFPNRYNE